MNGVSVVICCYNSAQRLTKTIEHIVKQEITSAIKWELIIVDNNSTDNTSERANLIWAEYNITNINFKIVFEEKQGLNNARLKGIAEATYEYILLCDDDNWLCPTYIETAYAIMANNPNIGVLGGFSEPISEFDLPLWFTTFQYAYAVGAQNLYSGDVSSRGYLWGAGMIFKKSVFTKLLTSGFRFQVSDRSGSSLECGGDSELCRWFLIAGYQLWYDERLKFKHFIPANRLEKKYVDKIFEGIEVSTKKLIYYDAFIRYGLEPRTLKTILIAGFHLVKYLIIRNNYSRACVCALIPFQANIIFDNPIKSIIEATQKYRNNLVKL
ncbi:glycosyltransferase [Spirosoma litoris]